MLRLAITTSVALVLAPNLKAKDYVILIGGGPTAAQSQASIERNVARLFEHLSNHSAADVEIDVFFGAGTNGIPDVCERYENVPEFIKWLAELIGPKQEADLSFRKHKLGANAKPATRQEIFGHLRKLSTTCTASDEIFIYVSGHGRRGTQARVADFQTWNDESITVTEFAQALQAFNPAVNVQLVMVQCYAGAFAQTLFVDGNSANGLTKHQQSGFFASLAQLPAAGCRATPTDDEYSIFFFDAWFGASRDEADFDSNQSVSFSEAHAFVVANAPTIDVPMKTSDQFLRVYSRIDRRDFRAVRDDEYYSRLRAVAGPADRYVMDRLSKFLKLGGENRIAEAKRQVIRLEYERELLDKKIDAARASQRELGDAIRKTLLLRWPFLKSPWNGQTLDLLTSDSKALENIVRQHGSFAEWQALGSQYDELVDQDSQLSIRWARCQRLIRAAESVALAHSLKNAASDEVREQFRQLVTLEAKPLPFARMKGNERP